MLTAFIDYIYNNPTEVSFLLFQHIELTLCSAMAAALIAIPFGIFATRVEKLGKVLLAISNLGQTIPSLAILGLVIPILGIGFLPSVFALILRALLPIFLNTYVGIHSVDKFTIESARGMGMHDLQILFHLELPLALPVIFAGIRTVMVQNVAIATLAAFIGAGGLGDLILQGLAMMDSGRLLAGAIPAAVLAIFLEFTMSKIEKVVIPRGLQVG
jgi:osmoprotectant transport system permease protein